MNSRRDILRSGAVTALGAPLLSVFGRPAFAQGGAAVKRIIFLYSPNGTVMKNFWPTDPADVTSRPILAPLAPFKNEVTLVRGLGLSEFNTPHEIGTSSALTNQNAFGQRPAGLEKRVIAGPSLDEALSRTIGARSFRPVLRLGPNGGGGLRGAFNFTMEGQKINSISQAASALEYLFGAAAGVTPMGEGSPLSPPSDSGKLAAWRDARRSMLDVLNKDASSLRARLPRSQQPKMDAALESIRSLEKNLATPTGGPSGGPSAVPGGPAPMCAPPAAESDTYKLFPSMIANAFACDLTRVVSWKLLACADVSVLGTNFHNTSHQTGKPEADEKLTAIHTRLAGHVADLVTALKNTPDPHGGGNLLQNTVIYWANECAHGNHDPSPLPIVLVGSAGGYIKTGRLVTVAKTEGSKYGNLLVSLANAVGDPMTVFGDKRWCTGPLTGLQG